MTLTFRPSKPIVIPNNNQNSSSSTEQTSQDQKQTENDSIQQSQVEPIKSDGSEVKTAFISPAKNKEQSPAKNKKRPLESSPEQSPSSPQQSPQNKKLTLSGSVHNYQQKHEEDPSSTAATASSSVNSLFRAKTFGSNYTVPSFKQFADNNQVKLSPIKQKDLEDQDLSAGNTATPVFGQSSSTFGSGSSKMIFGASTGGGGFNSLNKPKQDFSELLAQKTDEDESKTRVKQSETSLATSEQNITGEESDITVMKARVSIKKFDSKENEWKSRGNGSVHLNLFHEQKEGQDLYRARLIARSLGTMQLILNVSLFEGMMIKQSGEKSIIFAAIDRDGDQSGIVTYACKLDDKQQAADWFECISNLVQKDGVEKLYHQIKSQYNPQSVANNHDEYVTEQQYYESSDSEGDGYQDEDASESIPDENSREWDEYVPQDQQN